MHHFTTGNRFRTFIWLNIGISQGGANSMVTTANHEHLFKKLTMTPKWKPKHQWRMWVSRNQEHYLSTPYSPTKPLQRYQQQHQQKHQKRNMSTSRSYHELYTKSYFICNWIIPSKYQIPHKQDQPEKAKSTHHQTEKKQTAGRTIIRVDWASVVGRTTL